MTDKTRSPEDRRVSTHIFFFRTQKGMTCARLGKIVGVSPQQILNYERSDRVPAGILKVIADALEVKVDMFFEDLGIDDVPQKTLVLMGKLLRHIGTMEPSMQRAFGEFIATIAKETHRGADTPEGIEFTVGDMMAHFTIIDPL